MNKEKKNSRGRRYPMFDTSAIMYKDNLRFAYHPMVKDHEHIIAPSGPYESGFGGWGTVIVENGLFKTWRAVHLFPGVQPVHESAFIGYAESADGINWERPPLGVVDFMGNSDNSYTNLPYYGACDIMCDVSGRHKYYAVGMIVKDRIPERLWPFPNLHDGYYTAHSDDGFKWTIHPEPLTCSRQDVVSGAYDDVEERYVIIPKLATRFGGLNLRSMCWTDSSQFGKWGPIKPILAPGEGDFLEARRQDATSMDFQYMTILPYKNITLGFVSCFYHDPAYHTSGASSLGRNNVQLAWQEKRIKQGGKHPVYPDRHEYANGIDKFSPYGAAWRFLPGRAPVIQWGDERGVESDVYPSNIIEDGDEMLMYYGAATDWHEWRNYEKPEAREFLKEFGRTRVGRASIKRDRFASLWCNFEGMVELRHGKKGGRKIFVNAKCPRGCIKAELLDQQSYSVIKGFERENSIGFTGDSVRAELKWKNADVASIPAGTDLTIRFFIKTGDLFAYELGE